LEKILNKGVVMNRGAFIFTKNLFNEEEIQAIQKQVVNFYEQKTPVHGDGSYADLKWYQVALDPNLDFVKKIYSALEITVAELCVFYYLEPEARLHPHRDLTGAGLNNRIRFHVPIITNPKVEFFVDHERVIMETGDLWCLDTSYLHSVYNGGDKYRTHLIIECAINKSHLEKIPTDFKAKIHTLNYASILIYQLIKSVLVNSYKNPKYFKQQMSMLYKFIKWRILKIEKAK
jgi:Aspartyl/Asparaginyl beta-hydroxylase